jgi:hypothetical protein
MSDRPRSHISPAKGTIRHYESHPVRYERGSSPSHVAPDRPVAQRPVSQNVRSVGPPKVPPNSGMRALRRGDRPSPIVTLSAGRSRDWPGGSSSRLPATSESLRAGVQRRHSCTTTGVIRITSLGRLQISALSETGISIDAKGGPRSGGGGRRWSGGPAIRSRGQSPAPRCRRPVWPVALAWRTVRCAGPLNPRDSRRALHAMSSASAMRRHVLARTSTPC